MSRHRRFADLSALGASDAQSDGDVASSMASVQDSPPPETANNNDLHRLPKMTQGDTSSPGLALVTDLEFWDTDPKFVSNRNCLHALGAHLVNEIDVYDVRKTWSKAVAGAWLSKKRCRAD